jgi:hypothetical protein
MRVRFAWVLFVLGVSLRVAAETAVARESFRASDPVQARAAPTPHRA